MSTGTVNSTPLRRFYPQPDLHYFLTWLCWSVLNWIHRGDPLLVSNVSAQLSPLWYSVLQTLVALVSMDLQICLLNSESPSGSHWVLLPCAVASKSPKTGGWGNRRAHLAYFPSLRHHFPWLPDKQCLKNCYFIHFGHFLVVSIGE